MNSSLLAMVDFESLAVNATPNLVGQGIGGTIGIIITMVITIAGFALLAMLISAGYQYMTSAGNPKIVEQAQRAITYSLIGFIVVLISYLLASYFGLALKINQFTSLFGGVG